MPEKKTIQIFVTFNRLELIKQTIPYDIDEVQLKAYLRDLGWISSYLNSYRTTKVYLDIRGGDVEICKDKYRSLEELGIKENSIIIIVPGEPEPRTVYNNDSFFTPCLYGCPMAQSVKEAMSPAEMYSDDDSTVMTGTIGID